MLWSLQDQTFYGLLSGEKGDDWSVCAGGSADATRILIPSWPVVGNDPTFETCPLQEVLAESARAVGSLTPFQVWGRRDWRRKEVEQYTLGHGF